MKSFSLIEITIAVSIAAVAFVALFELAFGNISTAELIRQRLIAAHLAQEGIEIVSNIRTQNWLARCVLPPGACDTSAWRTGLNDGTYRAQYDSSSLLAIAPNPLTVDTATSFYCYIPITGTCSGNNSPFSRAITISTINDHQMKVVATVSWVYKGNSYSISAEDRMYNYL